MGVGNVVLLGGMCDARCNIAVTLHAREFGDEDLDDIKIRWLQKKLRAGLKAPLEVFIPSNFRSKIFHNSKVLNPLPCHFRTPVS